MDKPISLADLLDVLPAYVPPKHLVSVDDQATMGLS